MVFRQNKSEAFGTWIWLYTVNALFLLGRLNKHDTPVVFTRKN